MRKTCRPSRREMDSGATFGSAFAASPFLYGFAIALLGGETTAGSQFSSLEFAKIEYDANHSASLQIVQDAFVLTYDFSAFSTSYDDPVELGRRVKNQRSCIGKLFLVY